MLTQRHRTHEHAADPRLKKRPRPPHQTALPIDLPLVQLVTASYSVNKIHTLRQDKNDSDMKQLSLPSGPPPPTVRCV